MKYILLVILFVIGCASAKLKDSDIASPKDNNIQAKAEAEIKTVAGVDNSKVEKTEQSAGRDLITKIKQRQNELSPPFSREGAEGRWV